MLPLAIGMPIALADHVERSHERQLLRGTEGIVHSIALHPDDELARKGKEVYVLQQLPVCVFVVIAGAEWRVPGSKVPGLYPILPTKADWYLDMNRKYPRLKIKRRQLNIVAAFAKTIHSMQGADREHLVVDVCLRNESSR